MPVSRKFIARIKTALELKANASAASQMQRYMKSTMPFYGVKAPLLKQIIKQAIETHPFTSYQQWSDTVFAFWREAQFREERHSAILLTEAKQHLPYQTLDTLPLYEEMIVTGAWWDYVDPIASHRIAYLLKSYPKQIKPLMRAWSKDDDIWKRRTSIICQLLFKEETDLQLLYACIKPSLGSDEFFLQKAIGWALRQYSRYDLHEVQAFVETHQLQLSKLSIREALKNKDKILSAQ